MESWLLKPNVAKALNAHGIDPGAEEIIKISAQYSLLMEHIELLLGETGSPDTPPAPGGQT